MVQERKVKFFTQQLICKVSSHQDTTRTVWNGTCYRLLGWYVKHNVETADVK